MNVKHQLARSSGNVLARFHALSALERSGALDSGLVRELLQDANPRVRIQAMRASETLYKVDDKPSRRNTRCWRRTRRSTSRSRRS